MTPAVEVAQKWWFRTRPHRTERVGGGVLCDHHLCANYPGTLSDINGRGAAMRGSRSQP